MSAPSSLILPKILLCLLATFKPLTFIEISFKGAERFPECELGCLASFGVE